MNLFKSDKKIVEQLQKNLDKTFQVKFNEFKRDMQAYLDPMTGEEASAKYSSNKYSDYASAIEEVGRKYANKAAWGCALCANIIDFRAAVAVSSGPQYKEKQAAGIKEKDEVGKSIGSENGKKNGKQNIKQQMESAAEKEIEFVRSFFEANGINHEVPQDLGREAEIEGRIAVKLEWNEKTKQVIVEHLPWMKYRYNEQHDPLNKKKIIGISWTEKTQKIFGETIKAGSVTGDNLVCMRFAGRPSDDDPTPKIVRVLTEIDYISQAFRDWREIDRLYAGPVPIFECDSPEAAEDMSADIKSGAVNFKIKRAYAIHGNFRFAGPDMAGITSLSKEIERLACFISGETGYPLQFLLPDLLSNRSTSENIMESAMTHTASERAIWTGFYEELVTKAMAVYNEKSGMTKLDPTKISISISLMTQAQWDRLVSFWLPAFKDDLITREAALPQIPDFNVNEELERREKKDQGEVERITQQLDQMKKDAENNPNEPGGKQQQPEPDFGKKKNQKQGGFQ